MTKGASFACGYGAECCQAAVWMSLPRQETTTRFWTKCAFYKPLPPNQDWEGAKSQEKDPILDMEPEQLNKAKEVAFNVKEGLGLEYSIPAYTHWDDEI